MSEINLNLIQRAIGAVVPGYKRAVIEAEAYEQIANTFVNDARRAARTGRTDKSGYSQQPWGLYGSRTLNAYDRRVAVKKARQIYESNILGRSMLDRATDNIIGEGMYVQPKTDDEGFNAEAKAFWEGYDPDNRGMVDQATTQWRDFRNWKRDGDTGGLLLRSGKKQVIESDLIQSPNGSGDLHNRRGPRPEIVDGFKLAPDGRPIEAYIQVIDEKGRDAWQPVAMRNFLYIADTDRDDYTAIRGVPILATIGWILEQIDGTVEAAVMAYRMAAMFGLIRKAQSPGKTVANLPIRANASGQSQAHITFEPGMMGHIGAEEDIVQVKPEHPTTNYESFMTSLVRFAGLNLGLPLELALMDFSKTNYSSARASMEQAYRGFRVQQNRYASCWLSKLYRWRIAKAVKAGDLSGSSVPENYLNHQWFGQPWPYLNPVDDAQGAMALIGAGRTTLTEDLAKRGIRYEDWLDIKKSEIDQAAAAGVTLEKSNLTRDAEPLAATAGEL
ncbi:MAG: phage portal protein [Planctomycetota bacterium]